MSKSELASQMSSEERQKLAERLRDFRYVDRHNSSRYRLDRDLVEYHNDALTRESVEKTIAHIRKLSSNPILLDLGAGKGVAAKELAQVEDYEDIRVIGTSLSWSQDLADNLGEENIHITSAERLKGIERVDGIIASHSLYNANPELATRRIGEVLVPGGILLAHFYADTSISEVDAEYEKHIAEVLDDDYSDYPMRRHESGYQEFQKRFDKLGFSTDVFVGRDSVRLVAFKPGGPVKNPTEGFFFRLPPEWELQNIKPIKPTD